jgi:hypothetical protein
VQECRLKNFSNGTFCANKYAAFLQISFRL